jgi:hypothetical protein
MYGVVYFNDTFAFICNNFIHGCRSQWPCGLKRRSSAARLLRSWVRIPPGARKFVCCEWCVLSGRGLCDRLITRPEESYRLWRVVVCDQETSKNEEAKARYRAVENTTTMGCNARKTDKQFYSCLFLILSSFIFRKVYICLSLLSTNRFCFALSSF